jgi:hypothetical protein
MFATIVDYDYDEDFDYRRRLNESTRLSHNKHTCTYGFVGDFSPCTWELGCTISVNGPSEYFGAEKQRRGKPWSHFVSNCGHFAARKIELTEKCVDVFVPIPRFNPRIYKEWGGINFKKKVG